MGKRLFGGFFVIILIVSLAIILIQTQPKLNKPFARLEADASEPWAVQTGRRIATLNKRIPTLDRVVIVPDETTFLAAINKWSLKARWPILIEDKQYTRLFINKFKPAQIIKMPAVQSPPNQNLPEAMLKAVATAWEATDNTSLKKKWDDLGWEPPGVVFTSPTDPAWPAAVALAADRGQPLVFLEDDFGNPNDTLTTEQWETLENAIKQGVETTGYSYQDQADSIDTITLVRSLAVKYQSPNKSSEFLSVTDGLSRNLNQSRWAIVGWIYGTPARSVYQAMSAIFLQPKTAILYDSYPKQGNWKKYEMIEAAQELKKMGIDVTMVERPASDLETWQSLAAKKWEYDLILVNSSGSPTNFNAGAQQYATVKDIPKLNYPSAIHFLHSWSATTPDDKDTIAGRWLENGAYLYTGSVHEPYLSAFIPPKLIARRLQRSSPFLIAVRQLEMEPWKITTIGDPLTIFTNPRRRIPPTEALP
ncbi:hypothetical protein NG798_17980 [Ancylothrix sp. C2]|uniref:hypothetical protein n=1 Tax=Ancylothrix sp. D3o TaxID=2953691 RepID=UPI0021BADA7D|nr:hypothetical protein [Ancylothrix sp. D3o]MCT7951695.1 hypothetical protein [Ancylothrix sp. D3o]